MGDSISGGGRKTTRALVRWFAAALLAAGECAMAAYYTSNFSDALAGWHQRGDATFADVARGAGQADRCARIRVAPGADLEWQQLYRDFTRDVAPGELFSARVQVRSEGVEDGSGAYAVLEFLQGQRRLTVVHSAIGREIGAAGWQELRVEEVSAPPGTDRLRVSLVLHAHATAWFDDVEVTRRAAPDLVFSGQQRRIQVAEPRDARRFGGVGFHVFYHCHEAAPELLNGVIHKRWRELRPSFARVTHTWGWDAAKRAYVADQMAEWQKTGTEIYLTTWNPKDVGEDGLSGYAREVADMLEYFVRDRGLTNIRTYCLTNELSLNGWGTLRSDLPRFRAYHQAFHDEFRRRGLPVQLLATDAAPQSSWHTIEWAAANMDDVSGVYGGHDYFNRHLPRDLQFYDWFRRRCAWGVGIARSKGKDFIIGEFGCRQDGKMRDGKKNDACIFWDTPEEPWVGIQLAEAALAAVNAGVYAMGNWTFMDFPDDYRDTYRNKWGMFRWSGDDVGTRPHHYGFGLLTRAFRGPGRILPAACNDPRLRAAAVRNDDGALALAVVSRNAEDVSVQFQLPAAGAGTALRKYIYDPTDPPAHPEGDLQAAVDVLVPGGRMVTDTVPAHCLAVYVQETDGSAPPPVGAVEVARREAGVHHLAWVPSPAEDVAYYRVYRGNRNPVPVSAATRIGSAAQPWFIDRSAMAKLAHYRVVAVDRHGNACETE